MSNSVTLSPKYQVVIPKAVREALTVEPGAKFQVFVFENRVELVPLKKPRVYRGKLKGIKTDIHHESDRS